MVNKVSVLGGAAIGVASALCMPLAASAQGAGASVDWNLDADQATVIFYDAPENFDKHYRICFRELPKDGKLVVVLADRRVGITRETCIDVVSNKISLTLQGSDEFLEGIVYLVE